MASHSLSRHPIFVWIFTALSVLLVAGIHLDGWAHRSFGDDLDTFFTRWHAVLYGAFGVIAIFLTITAARNRRRGVVRAEWLPSGYGLSLVGVVVFLLGGLGDSIWHTVLGIETGVDALFSPTHLVLAIGAALIVSGPLRAMFGEAAPRIGFPSWIPTLISAALLLSVLAFMTQYVQPMVNPYASMRFAPPPFLDTLTQTVPNDVRASDPGNPFDHRQSAVDRDNDSLSYFRQAVGAAGLLWYAVLLAGIVLPLTRRGPLPFGSVTTIMALSAFFLTAMGEHEEFLVGAIAAGLLIDLLRSWYVAEAVVAFALPAIWTAMYFAVIFATGGTWWSIHFWTGTIVVAGIAGWLMHLALTRSASSSARA